MEKLRALLRLGPAPFEAGLFVTRKLISGEKMLSRCDVIKEGE